MSLYDWDCHLGTLNLPFSCWRKFNIILSKFLDSYCSDLMVFLPLHWIVTLKTYPISLQQRGYLPSAHSLVCFPVQRLWSYYWFLSHWYSERNMRMIQIQDNISEQKNLKDKLESEQEKLHMEYNKVSHRINRKLKKTHRRLYYFQGWYASWNMQN